MNLAIILHKYGVRIDDPCCYPLGFMYVSSLLKQLGHSVTIYNMNISDEYPDDFTVFDAVLMTGFEEFLPRIKATAHECRRLGVKTILGGALATFKPHEMLQYVDTVIVGESETVLAESLITNGIILGKKPHLNNLPYPDYEGFGVNEYHRRNGIKHIGVLTSRGCPWSCKFCAHTCHFQYRLLDDVFDEIDYYVSKYHPDMIVFNDNTLNVSKKRFMAICSKMQDIKMPWTGAIRLDKLDEEMVIASKKGNAKYFVVGVESFIQDKLDAMGKCLKVDDVLQGLDLLHKHGITYHGNVLVGLPGESKSNILNEVRAIPSKYNIFPMMVQPFIGTSYQERDINLQEYRSLQSEFRKYAESKQMNVYPEAI